MSDTRFRNALIATAAVGGVLLANGNDSAIKYGLAAGATVYAGQSIMKSRNDRKLDDHNEQHFTNTENAPGSSRPSRPPPVVVNPTPESDYGPDFWMG